jgi:DNA-binding response OmpR family regulator
VVSDPFPTGPRARILVIDEDTDTADTLRRSNDFEVTHIDEGWAAVDAVEKTDYDAILCALRVGAMSGASLHRLIVKTRPSLAPRVAFVAARHVVASAPPSSALGRVLARPVTVEHVRALLA